MTGRQGGSRRHVGAILLLIGLVILATARSLANGFVFDDVPIIQQNAQVHDLAPPWVYAQQSYWPPRNLGDAYRPWTIWWFAIQWAIFGEAPWGFHLGNLILTIAVTLSVYRLLLELVTPIGAVAGAAIFAVHPVHVEATGNVVGQSELWMTAFAVTACWLFLKARRSPRIRPWIRWAIALLAVLSAASKEQGVMTVALLLAIEWAARRPGPTLELAALPPPARWRRELPAIVAVATILTLAFLTGRYLVLGDWGGGVPAAGLGGLTLGGRALLMLPMTLDWIRLLWWPDHLLAEYTPPAYGGAPVWSAAAIGGLVAVIATTIVAVACRRRIPSVTLGFGWMAIALLPVANVIQPTGILLAERTLFLPSVGMAIVAGSLVGVGVRQARARGPILALLVLGLGWGASRSFQRQHVWHDNLTFGAQTIMDEPRSYRGYLTYGKILTTLGETNRAIEIFRKGVALYPSDVRFYQEWGQLHRSAGHCDLAVPVFERGVAIDSTDTLNRSRLFECLLQLGQLERALEVARAGVRAGSTEAKNLVTRAEEEIKAAAARADSSKS